MVDAQYFAVIYKVVARLKHCDAAWAITGSLGMVLQGMDIPVHDIDIQTDQNGAYEIERELSEYVTMPVRYLPSERIHSHLGKLEIDGIRVEVMGAVQKRIDEQTWEEPVDVEQHRKWVEIDAIQIPVLSLEYEYDAYLKLGRTEKAEKIREWLQINGRNRS
jgi:hypothetical protein